MGAKGRKRKKQTRETADAPQCGTSLAKKRRGPHADEDARQAFIKSLISGLFAQKWSSLLLWRVAEGCKDLADYAQLEATSEPKNIPNARIIKKATKRYKKQQRKLDRDVDRVADARECRSGAFAQRAAFCSRRHDGRADSRAIRRRQRLVWLLIR